MGFFWDRSSLERGKGKGKDMRSMIISASISNQTLQKNVSGGNYRLETSAGATPGCYMEVNYPLFCCLYFVVRTCFARIKGFFLNIITNIQNLFYESGSFCLLKTLSPHGEVVNQWSYMGSWYTLTYGINGSAANFLTIAAAIFFNFFFTLQIRCLKISFAAII